MMSKQAVEAILHCAYRLSIFQQKELAKMILNALEDGDVITSKKAYEMIDKVSRKN